MTKTDPAQPRLRDVDPGGENPAQSPGQGSPGRELPGRELPGRGAAGEREGLGDPLAGNAAAREAIDRATAAIGKDTGE
ncbi:hypothetical protein OPKNFCMD_0280 [Methylobacterium crusticola]|uniref:Uncharacterized protein n=1 Tax=Methylobacterium crusticola TaxID=1697972 RepID=A0ABQ4QSJ7_9HYPH|nr:hypothetical protein [Methylobacterium crusticola]GJD47572.1 hypothetical protein OPKNFCMD_0280 [Methylobacterium crusticola]